MVQLLNSTGLLPDLHIASSLFQIIFAICFKILQKIFFLLLLAWLTKNKRTFFTFRANLDQLRTKIGYLENFNILFSNLKLKNVIKSTFCSDLLKSPLIILLINLTVNQNIWTLSKLLGNNQPKTVVIKKVPWLTAEKIGKSLL